MKRFGECTTSTNPFVDLTARQEINTSHQPVQRLLRSRRLRELQCDLCVELRSKHHRGEDVSATSKHGSHWVLKLTLDVYSNTFSLFTTRESQEKNSQKGLVSDFK